MDNQEFNFEVLKDEGTLLITPQNYSIENKQKQINAIKKRTKKSRKNDKSSFERTDVKLNNLLKRKGFPSTSFQLGTSSVQMGEQRQMNLSEEQVRRYLGSMLAKK